MSGRGAMALPREPPDAVIRRFYGRVDRAMQARPPTRQWVKAALRRQGSPRCPVRLGRGRLTHEIILRHGDALADLFVEYADDLVFVPAYEVFVGYQEPGVKSVIDPIKVLTEEAEWTDEWGTSWRHAAGGTGASPISSPLEDWSQLDHYLAHQMPDPRAPGRLAGADELVAVFGASQYVVGTTQMVLFERFQNLRGMENALEDLYLHPRETERLLDALVDYYLEVIRSWGSMRGVDSLYTTDDWGAQTSMLIAPEMWRRYFASRYRRLFDEAHRSGLDVVFHSCGHITEIVGDLIDAGVDVLDPLQPDAMDLRAIARDYGGSVAFSGGISDQMLAVYTPSEIQDAVRRTIDTLGAPYGNAYIVAPSNLMLPDIPLCNLEALFEACHEQ